MKPAARRKVERQLTRMMGDNCTFCGKPFGHNTKTVGGITTGGVTGLAGECCAARIRDVVLSGVYVKQGYDLLGNNSKNAVPLLSQQALKESVTNLQNHVAEVDALGSKLSRQAGVTGGKVAVSLNDTTWKTDDAKWFKTNTSRSHRLRPLIEGELATLFGSSVEIPSIPPDHEFQVLVRQIEPGKRMRIPFARNLKMPIPDVEAVIHALFDTFSNRGKTGIITSEEIENLARRYAAGTPKA